MDTLVVTGHRPDKLGGYGWDNFSQLVFACDGRDPRAEA